MSLNKNITANFAGQAWTALMSMVFVPLYIKYLGMEAYGLIGIFAMIQAWLAILDMGMTPTLGREMARFTAGVHSPASIRRLLRSLEWIFAGLFILIFTGLALSSGIIATSWLKIEQLPVSAVRQAFIIMAAVAGLRFIESLYRSAIVGLQRQVLFNIANSISATLRGAGAIGVLAWYEPSIRAFFIWQAIVSLLTVICFAVIVYAIVPQAGPDEETGFSVKSVKDVVPFAGGVMATTFLALLLTQADKVILSRMLSLETFGLYSLAGVTAGVIYYISGPVTQAFTPRLAELAAKESGINSEESSKATSSLVNTYHLGSQIVNVLASTAAAMLIFFGERLLTLWTGDPILASRAAPIAALLGAGTFLNCTMHMPYMLQLAYGWSTLAAKVNAVAVAVLIPSVIYLASNYGIMGAASVWLLLNIGYVIFFVQLMHQRLLPHEKMRWYLMDFFLPIAVSFIMAFALSRIKLTFNSEPVELIFILVCGAVAALFSAFSADRIRKKCSRFIRSYSKKTDTVRIEEMKNEG